MRPSATKKSVDCLLLLGGNRGDRLSRLKQALISLNRLPRTRLLKRSRIYQTAPVGPSRRSYLNLAAKVRTALTPMGLLVECKRLEAAAGRKPGLRWGPRPLDIDIISYGRRRLRTRWLEIPHPRAMERAFVLAPLADIAPGWKPAGKISAARLLRRLNPGPGTVKIYQYGR